MVSRNFRAATLLMPLCMSGCASIAPPKGEGAPIPVTEFVNSLKCEYAQYVTGYHGKHLAIQGWPITGTMELNVLQSTDSTAGAEAKLVPFQGASANFGFSTEIARKRTVDTILTFQLNPKVANEAICNKAKGRTVTGGMGFGTWLWGIASSLDAAAEGPPKFGVSQLEYQLIFSVMRKNSGSGGIEIVPLKLSASALSQRDDVQTIKIKMVPNEIVVGKDKKGKPIKRKNIPWTMQPLTPLGDLVKPAQ